MKTVKKLILIAIFAIFAMSTQAQTPPHPGDGSGGGPGAGDPPVGAPIDGGLGIMFALAAVYSFRKSKNETR
jgi:hypothetical protein